MKPIIEITGLGKKYPIVHNKKTYGTLRDAIVNRLRHPFTNTQTHESFWALKDINLTINRGDIIGIIGKNGAGKSTLLKILSGITKPSEGKIKLYGKILRRFSLDELPQLYNILIGDMSLVGPRPEMEFIVQNYAPWQHLHLKAKPGLTGLWQILGRKNIPLHENLEYDFYYVTDRNLF